MSGGGSGLLLVWGALLAGYLLRPRGAWLGGLAVVGGYTLVTVALRGAGGLVPAVLAAGTSLAVLAVVSSLRARLAALPAGARCEARSDGLTGLLDRRAFDELLAHETARCLRSGLPLAMLLVRLDLDRDLDRGRGGRSGRGRGSGADDRVVRAASDVLRSQMRDSDVLARTGGGEFGVLLPACGVEDAVRRAEHIRSLLERTTAGWSEPVTASIGAAAAPGHADTPDGLYAAADAARRAARAGGGNAVAVAGAERGGTRPA